MKSSALRQIPMFGLASGLGVMVTVGLLLSIMLLANYRGQGKEQRPLLVVDLTAWTVPVEPPQKAPEPKPKPKKRPAPAEPVPLANKQEPKEIPPEPQKPAPTEEVSTEVDTVSEPIPYEPSLPTKDAEDSLPIPVPMFKLTVAPRFLHKEQPIYPEAMRAGGVSGVVKLEALIDKEGRVRQVNILKSAGEFFDDAARRAILASSFYPARVDSEPVAVLLRLPVKFSLL